MDSVVVVVEVGQPGAADRAMRAALIVALATMFVAAFGIAARSTYGAQTSSDEPQYLLTALSLAEDFDLDISDEIDRRAFEPFHEIGLNTQTFPMNEAGQRLSPHDPLLPIVAAPAMWVGGWVGVRILLVLVGGLVAGLTAWSAVRRFGVTPNAAALGAGSIMVGAPIAAYSTQVFPEILAALCVAALAASGAAPKLGRRELAVAIVAIVALPWLSVKYAPVAAAVTVVLGWRLVRERRRTALVISTAVLAASGIAYLVVHQRVYGGWTVYSAGDHFLGDGEFAVVGTDPDYLARSRRLVGLLADRRFGLIPWAPVWLLVPAALAAFLARRRPVDDSGVDDSGVDDSAVESAAIRGPGGPGGAGAPASRFDLRWLVGLPIAAGWSTATFVALTMHGWWSPGRQVVVIVPLAALALAWFVDRHRVLLRVTAVAALVGATNWMWLAIEASTDRRALIVDFYETAAPGFRLMSPLFAQGWPLTDSGDLVLGVWALLLGATAVLAWRAERRGGASGGRPAQRDGDAAVADGDAEVVGSRSG